MIFYVHLYYWTITCSICDHLHVIGLLVLHVVHVLLVVFSDCWEFLRLDLSCPLDHCMIFHVFCDRFVFSGTMSDSTLFHPYVRSVYRKSFVPSLPKSSPPSSHDPLARTACFDRSEPDLPGVKWYADGYGEEAFSLVGADGASPPGVAFRKIMMRFSTKVLRGYWRRLGLQKLQRKCPLLKEVPLGVRLTLSFVLRCDVTQCSAVDIHHYLVDLFSVTSDTMLNRPSYLHSVDAPFWLSDAVIKSRLLSESPKAEKPSTTVTDVSSS